MKPHMTQEEFIRQCTRRHKGAYDYSKVVYTNSTAKILVGCTRCGNTFKQIASSHKLGHGCPACAKKNSGKGNLKSFYSFRKKAEEKYRGKYVYNEGSYINTKIPCEIVCPLHGVFLQKPHCHLARGTKEGCPKCGEALKVKKKTMTNGEFISKAKIVHGDRYDYSRTNYTHNKVKITIICPIHGPFIQSPSNHIRLLNGCPTCNESKGEGRIRRWLREHNIAYCYNKRFTDCLGIAGKRLVFDFYLPEVPLLIEYDGKQHFETVYAGWDTSGIQERDSIKNKWAENSGIRLLRIPYTRFKSISSILGSQLLTSSAQPRASEA